MEYRRLGNSGLKVSSLSFGSWVTFVYQLDESSASKCMDYAYNEGVNLFYNSEAYANGKAAGDTNAFFKAATYIGAKTLPGELTYSINKNNATGRLELGMQAKGESVKEINRQASFGNLDMQGNLFSDSYFINLTSAAKDYANPTNPYNSTLLSTNANINEAKKLITIDFDPIDDVRASKEYRKKISQNLLERFYSEQNNIKSTVY